MKSKLEFTAEVLMSSNPTQFVNQCGIFFFIRVQQKQKPDKDGNIIYDFYIENKKGNFEFTKITQKDKEIKYDKKSSSFSSYSRNSKFIFYISTNVEYVKNDYQSKFLNVFHSIWIPSDLLKALGTNEYSERSFKLRGYDFLTFKYFIKKVDNSYIQLHVENPLKIEICGKTADYVQVFTNLQSRTIYLNFTLDPSKFKSYKQHGSESVESRLNFVVQALKPTLYEIMANSKYFDVILISSDQIEIKTHRCILDKFSTVFAKIIADSKEEFPVKIKIEEFNAETIQASLDFLYEKYDSINEKEVEVFKFASAYSIDILKEVCCLYFVKAINAKNVCEYIQIACENDFKDLKQECKTFIISNKKDIDLLKLKELPKDIIFYVFCT